MLEAQSIKAQVCGPDIPDLGRTQPVLGHQIQRAVGRRGERCIGQVEIVRLHGRVALGEVEGLEQNLGARARALVAGLAVRSGLCPAASVARHFSRARATLCEQMAASRQREEDRQLLGTPIQLILDDLKRLSTRAAR